VVFDHAQKFIIILMKVGLWPPVIDWMVNF